MSHPYTNWNEAAEDIHARLSALENKQGIKTKVAMKSEDQGSPANPAEQVKI